MAVSLNATIGLVTTKFTSGVARLGGAIKGIGSKIRGMVSGATGRLAMLAGAAGLGMVIRKAIALGKFPATRGWKLPFWNGPCET